MDYAVLDISFRKYSFYSLREACQIIGAGDMNNAEKIIMSKNI